MASPDLAGPVPREDTELLISTVRELRAHGEIVAQSVLQVVAALQETQQRTRALTQKARERRTE
jgi:hypothetical protein